MARKTFLGFDYTDSATAVGNGIASSVWMALPPGAVIVSKDSDTTFLTPSQFGLLETSTAGRTGGSSALGKGNFATNLQNTSAVGSGCVAVTRSSLGNPQEIWATCDVYLPTNAASSLDNPASMMRSEARFQIFKWGDLSLRFRRMVYQASPFQLTWEFEAFNGLTSLGTITLPPYNAAQWAFVRIRARLDSGTAGMFNITIDGVSLNTSGINSVATTPLGSATHLYFSGGALGDLFGSPGSIKYYGLIDNVLIDDAAFPTGRPAGVRASLASDGTLTNWAPNGNTSVASALTSLGTARGTGTGATALLNLGSINTAGWETNLLGWQLVASGISNLDPLVIRKLRAGVDLSGTPFNGSLIETLIPPMTPSSIVNGYNMDTVWTKGGGADFVLADIVNIKARLEVVA